MDSNGDQQSLLALNYQSAADWTYFIQAVGGGPIKIGFTSRTPNERLAALQTGSPVELRIVGLLHGNREREMHERFKDDRLHGEWFNPSRHLVVFITNEAQQARVAYVQEESRLQLEGKAVHVVDATTKHVGPSWFDVVLKNDDELMDRLLEAHQWPDIDEGEFDDADESELEDARSCSEYGIIEAMACTIMDEPFVEAVGLNVSCGWICFICGPCNSHKRFALLEDLACLAYDLDCITGEWFPFAVFWDGVKQVGIDLIVLGYPGGFPDDNRHIFDPNDLCRDRGSAG